MINNGDFQYDVFLSHSSADEAWVRKLSNALQARGVRVWVDIERISPGDRFTDAIDEGLKQSRSVAVILSPNALLSDWVSDECAYVVATAPRRTPKAKLIPILIEAVDKEKVSFIIATRNWVDFNDAPCFEENLARLLRGIWPDLNDLFRESDPQFTPVEIQLMYYELIISAHKAMQSVPLDTLESFYNRVAPIGFPPTPKAQNVKDILAKVMDIPSQRGRFPHPLLEFLELLSFKSNLHPNHRIPLRSEKLAELLDVKEELMQLRQKIQSDDPDYYKVWPYLLVEIEPHTADDQLYFLKAWLWRQKNEVICIPPSDYSKPYSLEGLRSALDELIATQRKTGSLATPMTLEFFLPVNLLSYAVDQWKIKLPLGEQAVPTGQEYRVVVRSQERLTCKDVRHKWLKKWQVIKDADPPQPDSQSYFASTCQFDTAKLYTDLGEENIVCLLLDFMPEINLFHTILYQAINAGIPIAMWCRCLPKSNSVREEMTKLIKYDYKDWPEQLWKARREASGLTDETHPGKSLVLLWDDPERLPFYE
jgi:hypothetical protein